MLGKSLDISTPVTLLFNDGSLQSHWDGSVTVWLSEHEPMNRMKGMVGVCVYPGKALFELKVQLFNRTPLPQPFLWWVNTAVHVNDNYQLNLPTRCGKRHIPLAI